MKRLMIAALVAGQLTLAAQPAMAAELIEDRARQAQQTGAFGGVRLRVPLDGSGQARAGLALAPTLHGHDGASVRFGEGLELSASRDRPLQLMLAGMPLARLGAAQAEEEDEDGDGPSTLGWIAIGAGALLVGLVAAVAICAEDHDCIPSE
ncbi:MAG: hypothetical protein ACT4OE_08990 [Sphingosinicella sp.]